MSVPSPPAHFVEALIASLVRHADATAIEHRDSAYRYGQLHAAARSAAERLRRLGLQPGDRVALVTGEKLPFLIAQLGTLLAGGVSLPLNPKFTAEELRYFLGDSEARFAVAGDDRREAIAGIRAALPQLEHVLSEEDFPADASDGGAPGSSLPPATPRSADDACLILYSSGTTGWPKGIVHTNANVGSALHALGRCWRMSNRDVVLNVLPLFHIHGLAFATHLTLLHGGRLILHDAFEPAAAMAAIAQSTVFMAVPAIYYRLLEHPEFRSQAANWQGVRLFTCGSAPIRPEVLPELEGIVGRPIINRYGMTEAYVITSLPLDGPWPNGSVGQALDGVEVVVGDEQNRPLPAGEVGRVLLRGPNLFGQYWNKPEATRQALADGWFETGDLGSLDEHGFLTLAGRQHDLIITNGYNVYPQVVERVVNSCPGVRESAVLGVPDARRGERVAAAVVRSDPQLDEQRLADHLAERLVDYQRPRQWLFVDELPRNALGKVLRNQLRDMLSEGTG